MYTQISCAENSYTFSTVGSGVIVPRPEPHTLHKNDPKMNHRL